MMNLNYDNKFRKIFENRVFGSQKISHIVQIAQSECRNIINFDYKHLDYLIFQFTKVEKELELLKKQYLKFENEQNKSKEDLKKYGRSRTQVIRIFDVLNHWENFLAGIKQSLDFIVSVFADFNLTNKKKASALNFMDSDGSRILEISKIFKNKKQYQNLITTRNAFTHNYFMKHRGQFNLDYLRKSRFGTFKIDYTKRYDILKEAKSLFEKYIQLVGNYMLIMFKRQEFYNKIINDLNFKKSHFKLYNRYINSGNDFFFEICFLNTNNKFILKDIDISKQKEFIKLLKFHPTNIDSFF